MSAASLYTLPIELIYHIVGHLDIQTTLFSFRHVCRRLYTIINGFSGYEVDLSTISKIDFHRVCRIIHPVNIASLTLSDNDMTPGQIGLFMALFNLDQFIHLRSLTLVKIDKSQLIPLMEQVNLASLDVLSINIRNTNSTSRDASIISLLSSIAESHLRKLELSMWSYDINSVIWPQQCTIQHLTIGHYVTFKQVCKILGQLSNLKVLVIKNCIVNDTGETMIALSDAETNRNVTSLTFKNSRLHMSYLELLLSLTPSLIHLQLTGNVSLSDSILDGSRWEHLIEKKLPSLRNFMFFFRAKTDGNFDATTIESWIVPFRTMFWLKHKSWFVTCNYISKTSTFRLYTIPICDNYITYESDVDKNVLTTYKDLDNDTFITNHVCDIHLDLTVIMTTIKAHKITPRTHHLFRKLTGLILSISGEWPVGSNEYLSTLIDLTSLTTLELYVDFDHCLVSDTISNIGCLLAETCNVHSLTLSNSSCRSNLNGIVDTFCSIVPHHVKHLDIYDMDLDDIKILLERLKHLSSISFVFFFDMPFSLTEIIEWLSQRRNFTYLLDKCSLSLWLGQNTN